MYVGRRNIRFLGYLFAYCVIIAGISACLGTRGIEAIKARPYPVLYEDYSTARFGDEGDNAFVEVRTAKTSRPMENLAIHYAALFPGGEIIRPGDSEEYLRIDGHNAYKVVFRTKYIRKRKRLQETGNGGEKEVPEGWTPMTMEDPLTGKPIPVLHGPVVPQQRVLYLVQGDTKVYYVFLRTDGDSIDEAVKNFDQFVREGIDYK